MIFKKVWLILKWNFGYRAVLGKEPSQKFIETLNKVGRMVAEKKCPVCGKAYWVIGNPKIKGKFSLVCNRRKCYLIYYGDWAGNPANRIKTPRKEVAIRN